VHLILTRSADGVVATDDAGATERVDDLRAYVTRREAEQPRWVWDDTPRWYPELLAAGVRVARCHDLRLCHIILRNSALTAASTLATAPANGWDAPFTDDRAAPDDALFDLAEDAPRSALDPVAEFRLQQAALEGAEEPGRLGRLLAAESAGALIAAEMSFMGLPWHADVHDRILQEILGPRPAPGERPAALQALAAQVREALEAPELNPDSPVDLLKALGNAGLRVKTTSKWELRRLQHPVIEPLLEYKRLARLLSANGWHWLDTWVIDGRFRPTYLPGGVVTGRWASDGGGALQLPKQVRSAVIADPGWRLVVADASQLEPRVLTGMARDEAMAKAGEGDLYAGIVASGAVETRDEAKVAMLGAMYGATTGDSGRLMPKLLRAYPRAIGLVEQAARAGERGEVVTTTLGRSSPRPAGAWARAQSEAALDGASDPGVPNSGEPEPGERGSAADRARSQARSWGRFTRNFIVQGSAAEWALCWMAGIRNRLTALSDGAPLAESPHLVFFLHDEVVVHTPAEHAESVATAIRDAASEAGRLLFGATPVSFPLQVAVVEDYGSAK
jgi:DNA polymerase-1